MNQFLRASKTYWGGCSRLIYSAWACINTLSQINEYLSSGLLGWRGPSSFDRWSNIQLGQGWEEEWSLRSWAIDFWSHLTYAQQATLRLPHQLSFLQWVSCGCMRLKRMPLHLGHWDVWRVGDRWMWVLFPIFRQETVASPNQGCSSLC